MKMKIILFSILIVVLASLFASSHPDGLEKVAEHLGFIEKARANSFSAPAPDYLFPGITNETFATILAGISGVLLIFGSSLIILKFSK